MKRPPKAVFILENGKYIEISNEEFCFRKENVGGYKERKFIPIQGRLIEVSKADYADFHKKKNREKYVNRLARYYRVMSYNALDSEEDNGEEILADDTVDVEGEVERSLQRKKVKEFLKTLEIKDRELIIALYYNGKSEREYAAERGIYRNAVHERKLKILKKLKVFLEK